jgi:hypothetical protein
MARRAALRLAQPVRIPARTAVDTVPISSDLRQGQIAA